MYFMCYYSKPAPCICANKWPFDHWSNEAHLLGYEFRSDFSKVDDITVKSICTKIVFMKQCFKNRYCTVQIFRVRVAWSAQCNERADCSLIFRRSGVKC